MIAKLLRRGKTLPQRHETALRASLRTHLLAGAGVGALLVVCVGGWAATAEISSAVIASGKIVADSRVQSVQHPTGGLVSAVMVDDGDRVEAGQTLVRLDDTLPKASLAIVTKEIDHLVVRRARFQAERDGATAVKLPEAISSRSDEPTIAEIVADEIRIFNIRRDARENQKAQLRERIAQLQNEGAAYSSHAAAIANELELSKEELATSTHLREKQLTLKSAHLALQRNVARLEGTMAQIEASEVQVKGKITETELQILQIDRDLASEAGEELRTIDRRLAELEERRVAGEDTLRRTEILAPQAGIVHQSRVHTIGGVIGGDGQPIMLLVPEDDDMAIEARVVPADIDQIKIGGSAILRLSAFNQRTTPEIVGVVEQMSADTTVDPTTGESFYTVRIKIAHGEAEGLGSVELLPGMPVEVFIRTGDRTVLSHLVKPLGDHVERAFRQD